MSRLSSKRVMWMVVPLLTVSLLLGLLWYSGRTDAEAEAARGAREAVERKFSLLDPGSWTEAGGTGRWFGEGMEAVMTWEHNPWRRPRIHVAGRLRELRESADPEKQAEYQRLKKLGREWEERLLARFPDLVVPEDKTVPEEKNAFSKLMALFKNLDETKAVVSPAVPDELKQPGQPLDQEAAATILADHRGLIDQLREIGLMTGHSSEGYDPGDSRPNSYDLLLGGDLLLLDARMAAARGDITRALESIEAARGLAAQLTGAGSAGTLEGVLAGVLGQSIRQHVMESILPSLPADQIDLSSWEAATGARVGHPKDYAAMQRNDWNSVMSELLPAMVDTSDVSVPPDGDLILEIYTRHMRDGVTTTGAGNLNEMATTPRPAPKTDHLSWRSQELAGALGLRKEISDLFNPWLNLQASEGMTHAAFAILNGKPVPNDPVSGQPYRWDPATRTLALPDVPRYSDAGIPPVKLPKGR